MIERPPHDVQHEFRDGKFEQQENRAPVPTIHHHRRVRARKRSVNVALVIGRPPLSRRPARVSFRAYLRLLRPLLLQPTFPEAVVMCVVPRPCDAACAM
jgi:hypothetical protein